MHTNKSLSKFREQSSITRGSNGSESENCEKPPIRNIKLKIPKFNNDQMETILIQIPQIKPKRLKMEKTKKSERKPKFWIKLRAPRKNPKTKGQLRLARQRAQLAKRAEPSRTIKIQKQTLATGRISSENNALIRRQMIRSLDDLEKNMKSSFLGLDQKQNKIQEMFALVREKSGHKEQTSQLNEIDCNSTETAKLNLDKKRPNCKIKEERELLGKIHAVTRSRMQFIKDSENIMFKIFSFQNKLQKSFFPLFQSFKLKRVKMQQVESTNIARHHLRSIKILDSIQPIVCVKPKTPGIPEMDRYEVTDKKTRELVMKFGQTYDHFFSKFESENKYQFLSSLDAEKSTKESIFKSRIQNDIYKNQRQKTLLHNDDIKTVNINLANSIAKYHHLGVTSRGRFLSTDYGKLKEVLLKQIQTITHLGLVESKDSVRNFGNNLEQIVLSLVDLKCLVVLNLYFIKPEEPNLGESVQERVLSDVQFLKITKSGSSESEAHSINNSFFKLMTFEQKKNFEQFIKNFGTFSLQSESTESQIMRNLSLGLKYGIRKCVSFSRVSQSVHQIYNLVAVYFKLLWSSNHRTDHERKSIARNHCCFCQEFRAEFRVLECEDILVQYPFCVADKHSKRFAHFICLKQNEIQRQVSKEEHFDFVNEYFFGMRKN